MEEGGVVTVGRLAGGIDMETVLCTMKEVLR